MQRCSEKAFAMCPTRHLCGRREDATFTDDSECAAYNRAVEEAPMTNADRIRSMTDEELAEFIRDVSHECQDPYSGRCFLCKYPWCSTDDTEKWLKQPAEVE